MIVKICKNLKMPLGKEIAQVSHAAGKAWLDRCEYSGIEGGITLLKMTERAFRAHESELGARDVGVEYHEVDDVISTEGGSEVVDVGRTVFTKPTLTCIALAPDLGPHVDTLLKLPFNPSSIDFKQGFFINRRAEGILLMSHEDLISLCASASADHILMYLNEDTGNLDLPAGGAMHSWLTSAFGKTVVGTKKASKFLAVRAEMSSLGIIDICFDGEVVGFCTPPMPSEELESRTRSKTFRLLDSIS